MQSATASFALKLAPGAVNVPLRPGAGIFFDQDVGLGEDAEVLGDRQHVADIHLIYTYRILYLQIAVIQQI